jgi:hypothetical protein
MSWLKKVGQEVLKITGLWETVAPLAGRLIPGLGQVSNIIGIIVSVEQLFTAAYGTASGKGSDKLKAATPQVAQLIQSTEFFQGKKLVNPTLAEQAFTQITSAFADLLNAYGD